MEMMMDRLRDDFSEEWDSEEFPLVRYFKVPQGWDFSAPCENIPGGAWLSPSSAALNEFSAVGWFFAKELYKKYRIPVGLVNTAWGGTPVESWMSADALASYPEKIAEGEQYADAAHREKIAQDTDIAIQEWEALVSIEDLGTQEKWQNNHTDISGWNDIELPGNFSDNGLPGFCGVIWLAKDFEIDETFSQQDARVWLGTIVDSDIVYINGSEIGNTAYRYPPRKYVPYEILKQGANRIVIRVTCRNGEGGVTCGKPFRIFSDNEIIELAGTWKYKIGAEVPPRPSEFFFQWQPMGNYNAMIAPVLKFPFKGIIWYQGESNTGNPGEYGELFKRMIQDWREKNNNNSLPFLFVQLPIFGAPGDNNENASWAIIRQAQTAALSLPATGMACAMELGEWNDLHPINKKGIGLRLFLAAEKTVFNNENTSPGPMLCRYDKQQDRLYLFFENCGSGLTTTGDKAYVTVIDGSERARLAMNIEGSDFASVDISSLFAPEKVLYAWADNPADMQLINSDGLPAVPFMIKI
jgi:sialate O-acetylesterase